jgi:predicted nucleic acid-binding protein
LAANLEDALSTEVQWAEVDHREVLALALATGLSTYDASYLYLALILNVPIVTFDDTQKRLTDIIEGSFAQKV